MSDHPVVGGIIGSLLAPTIAGGAVTVANNTANQAGRLFGTTGAAEREALQRMSQQPGYNITMPQVDQTLGQLDYTGYWTANRIASAPDYQKRQAVKNLLATNSTSQAAPTPGLLSNLQNYAVSLPGLGLAAGGALDAFSHHLGLPSLPGVAEGLGLGAGDVLQKTLAPFLQRRAAAFNQSVDNLLKNNRGQVWQQYQQQQYQPSLMQRLGMGFVAPQVSNQMAP